MAFSNWDGSLADIGPIYPWVGLEVPMVILGFAFWIGWHVIQMRQEGRRLDAEARALRQGGELQNLLRSEQLD